MATWLFVFAFFIEPIRSRTVAEWFGWNISRAARYARGCRVSGDLLLEDATGEGRGGGHGSQIKRLPGVAEGVTSVVAVGLVFRVTPETVCTVAPDTR